MVFCVPIGSVSVKVRFAFAFAFAFIGFVSVRTTTPVLRNIANWAVLGRGCII